MEVEQNIVRSRFDKDNYRGPMRNQSVESRKTFKKNKEKVKENIENLIVEIRNNPNIPPQKKQKMLEELRGQLETLNENVNIEISTEDVEEYNTAVRKMSEVRNKMQSANATGPAAGSAVGGSGASSTSNVSGPGETSETGKSDGASKSEGDDEKTETFKDFDPEKFANLMLQDPQKAMDKLQEMEMKEMNIAMQVTQSHMQNLQRMSQLHSNLSKTSHKMQSAIIRNIS